MQIEELFIREQAAIKRLWIDHIVEAYPLDSRDFFKNRNDRFQNPVGAAVAEMVDSLFTALTGNAAHDDLALILDDFIKIRAVQDFAPSVSIGFILYLKHAVREILSKDIVVNDLSAELWEFDGKVDRLQLIAFDVYSRSRDKLFEIRANELKRSSFIAFKLTGKIPE